jgi:hypothetical protein
MTDNTSYTELSCFERAHRICVVIRHPDLGHLCGYVGVSKRQSLYGKGYDENLCGHHGCYDHTPAALFDVHGGLTFAGRLETRPNLWFFGFDCGHIGDSPEIQNEAYVRKECERLADQLASGVVA